MAATPRVQVAVTEEHLRMAVEAVAELAVLRALEAAGKRARLPRPVMVEAATLVSHEVHVRFQLARDPAQCDRLLAGVFDHVRLVLPHPDPLVRTVDGYVRQLIVTRTPHHRTALQRVLRAELPQ